MVKRNTQQTQTEEQTYFEVWKNQKVVKTSFNKELKSFNNFSKFLKRFEFPEYSGEELKRNLGIIHQQAQLFVSLSQFKKSSKEEELKIEKERIQEVMKKLNISEFYPELQLYLFFSKKKEEESKKESKYIFNMVVSLKFLEKEVFEKITNFEKLMCYYPLGNEEEKLIFYKKNAVILHVLYTIEVYNSLSNSQREELLTQYLQTIAPKPKPKIETVKAQETTATEPENNENERTKLITLQATLALEIYKNGKTELKPALANVEAELERLG